MTPNLVSLAAADAIVIEIGNTPMALHTDNPAFRQLLRQRYVTFLRPAENPRFVLSIELTAEESDPAAEDRDEDLNVIFQAGRWILKRGDFFAEWDPATGVGLVRQSLNPYSVDTVLRIVHSLILVQEGGFLLHSASAVRAGQAFLFAGISGAGKTTISRLAPPEVILLTDEISYVKLVEGKYSAFGTPFAGELAKLGENIFAPISTLFFLEKGAQNRVEPVPREEAVRRLLRNILFFADDPELVKRVFQSALNFLEQVAVKRLVFTPDERVWEMIVRGMVGTKITDDTRSETRAETTGLG